jgi:hypothetical protein
MLKGAGSGSLPSSWISTRSTVGSTRRAALPKRPPHCDGRCPRSARERRAGRAPAPAPGRWASSETRMARTRSWTCSSSSISTSMRRLPRRTRLSGKAPRGRSISVCSAVTSAAGAAAPRRTTRPCHAAPECPARRASAGLEVCLVVEVDRHARRDLPGFLLTRRAGRSLQSEFRYRPHRRLPSQLRRGHRPPCCEPTRDNRSSTRPGSNQREPTVPIAAIPRSVAVTKPASGR